jgi:hypothetical protein
MITCTLNVQASRFEHVKHFNLCIYCVYLTGCFIFSTVKNFYLEYKKIAIIGVRKYGGLGAGFPLKILKHMTCFWWLLRPHAYTKQNS